MFSSSCTLVAAARECHPTPTRTKAAARCVSATPPHGSAAEAPSREQTAEAAGRATRAGAPRGQVEERWGKSPRVRTSMRGTTRLPWSPSPGLNRAAWRTGNVCLCPFLWEDVHEVTKRDSFLICPSFVKYQRFLSPLLYTSMVSKTIYIIQYTFNQ